MNDTKNFTTEAEDRIIEDAFREVLDGYLKSNHRKKVEIIERAFKFAKEAHKGIRRRSGEPYILHPIAVAKIASQEIGLGSTSICAALLHDVVEDTDYTVEDIEQNFGKKIAQLVEGLTKISGGIFGDKASAQAENFRKLLLTMSEDIRVVLIKMADRLHNMRTLGSMAPNKQYKIAGETLYIYAPLAHRLGLFAIKTELENLSFKYEHPDAFNNISRKIAATEGSRNEIYRNFAAPVLARLDRMGLKYTAKARVKSVYSIWNKMETKHIPFEEVYDLYAARIVFDCDDPAQEKSICWQIYSAITDIYRLHPDRTRDWISSPKANGYQALHLTVMGPDGNWIEVQIRSRRMDEIAEKGFAAHWKYKVGEGDEESELNAWLHTIKDILDDPEPNALDFLDTLKLNLFASEIVVFTPKGELITLPMDATVLDVAFHLHTQIGCRCIAGKVNHKLVPLSQKLNSGDQVEVLTSQSQTPKPEWIDFLATAKGKTRLRASLRKLHQPAIAAGKGIFAKFLKENDIADDNVAITKVMGLFKAASKEELYYLLGNQEIVLNEYVVKTLRKQSSATKRLLARLWGRNPAKEQPETTAPAAPAKTPINTKETYVLKYDDNGEANFRLAGCCNPVPGDDVLGFIDDDGEVVVHSLDCPRAGALKASFGPRLLSTRWEVSDARFLANIHIEGIDRQGILHELISLISTHLSLNIRSLDIRTEKEVFQCDMSLLVTDATGINDLCAKVRKIPGVEKVARI
ncbi:MAG: bifunctional (p)ppGpp synthetase/guanosine-3',5'-bis(diphosphate) 3'-pyrophosphohydrolase [Muribaculaceae bacterium]|jgi:GTP pyrophosphokinase|nr:bifunctional (p)ppGpp synthetase/guanosine-3',5'-bis(diphosphate) 3'-pyrophosphohydrolase [Muribaculaceae bacterium]